MQWYNSRTKELQSNAPWGASYMAQEVIAELYSDWQQVADEFLPQASNLTTKEQLAALDTEYEGRFNELSTAWATASMGENNVAADEIKEEYRKLKEEYKTKREAISNAE